MLATPLLYDLALVTSLCFRITVEVCVTLGTKSLKKKMYLLAEMI